MEFIVSNKGGSKVCYDNYMYLKTKVLTKKIRWECIKRRKNSCRAILYTDLKSENPVVEGNHIHDGSASETEVAKLRASLKEKALQSNEAPKQLMDSVFANLDEETRAKLGRVTSLIRSIKRHQQIGKLNKSSHGKAEQDLELLEESAKIAEGETSHTSDEVQQDSLCPEKLEPNPEVFQEASLSVQEHDDPNPAGKKRRRGRGNLGAVQRRKRQCKRAGPKAVQEERKLMEPEAVQEEQRLVQPEAVQEEQRLVQPEAVQKEQRLVQPETVQEEQRLVQPEAVQEERRLEQPVAVQEEQRLVQPEAVQEEQRFVQPEAVQEEQRLVQLEAVQKEQRLVQPVEGQEKQRLVQSVAVQEVQKLVQPVAVQEEQQLVQPTTVQKEHKRMQPEAVHEQERTSPEAVQGQNQDPFISDPVEQEQEPGSPVDSLRELAFALVVVEQVRENNSRWMILEHWNPEEQAKENVNNMTAQELLHALPVQEPESTSSKAVRAVQELPCVPVVQERENTILGAVQEWPRLPVVQCPQGACSEVASAFPCVPAIQEPESTSSGTFQGLTSVAAGRMSPDGIQEFSTAQNLDPDTTQNYPRVSMAQQTVVFDNGIPKPFSLAEELQRRLEVVTSERDLLLHAKSKWEEEKILLTDQKHYLESEKASFQQYLDTLISRTRLILSEEEDWRKWKADIENEMDRILSEQMKLHEEKIALGREKEAFLQEKTKWEMQMISFQHERDSFQIEKLKREKEGNYILEDMNSFMCKPHNYYGDSDRN